MGHLPCFVIRATVQGPVQQQDFVPLSRHIGRKDSAVSAHNCIGFIVKVVATFGQLVASTGAVFYFEASK